MAGRARKRSPVRPAKLEEAAPAPYPGFIEFCLATLRPRAPQGDRWVHEIKLDGYRLQLHLRDGVPVLYTRRGFDWTHRFGRIAEAAKTLKASNLILDGEVTIPGENNAGDFGALQAALGDKGARVAIREGDDDAKEQMVFFAFDLLYIDGNDLREEPLIARKAKLADLLAKRGTSDRIRYVRHFDADGAEMSAAACNENLEGVISKLRDAPYRSGRGLDWIKAKCNKRGQFVVVGFDPAPGSVAALRLARVEGGKLVYAGKVGTGFSAKSATEVRAKLEPLLRKTHALSHPLRKPKARWIEPRFEAEVEYLEFSSDGMLRHPSFRGLTERTKRARQT
jgi:bifunctional non-homologous end joining protein LigD